MLLLLGCTSDYEVQQEYESEVSSNDENLIKNMLQNFNKIVHNNQSRGLSCSEVEIDRIEQKFYKAGLDGKIKIFDAITSTRSNPEGDIFDVSTVSFHIGESSGYALLSCNERINKVFYYTENGSLSDTCNNEVLADIFRLAPNIGASIMSGEGAGDGNGGGDDNSEDEDEDDNPDLDADGSYDHKNIYNYDEFVTTNWGQDYPYCKYTPACSCTNCLRREGHKPLGCVAVATSQFIIHMGKFVGKTNETKNIDFNRLRNKLEYYNIYDKDKAARLGFEVATECKTSFKCDGSGADIKDAYSYLKSMGYDVEYHSGGLDEEAAKKCLSNKWPIIVGGKKGLLKTGHVWLLDGIKRFVTEWHYHCCWGYNGKSDGWVDSYYYVLKMDDETTHYCYSKSQIYLKSF